MTRDVYVERAARHAALLYTRISVRTPDAWERHDEPYRQAMRADVAEILDESGYPAALDAAAELLHAVADDHEPERDGGTDDRWPMDPICANEYCGETWPCNTDRARAWLAEHDEQTT